MIDFLLVSGSLLYLVGVDIWHGILLLRHSQDSKPHTIREHAVANSQSLRQHLIVRALSSHR